DARPLFPGDSLSTQTQEGVARCACRMRRGPMKKLSLRVLGVIGALFLLFAVAAAVHEGPPNTPRTRPAWLSHELYPFEDHWMDIDGNQVHYVDEGHGPVVLLLHGNPDWSFLYRNIIRELSGTHRCIA